MKVAREHGIDLGNGYPVPRSSRREVLAAIRGARKRLDVARALGVTLPAVFRYLRRYGLWGEYLGIPDGRFR